MKAVFYSVLVSVSAVFMTASGEPPETRTFTVGGVEFSMSLIPPGTFVMGAPPSERGWEDDEIQHQVTITRPFYMMQTEVTRELYEAVVGSVPAGMNDDRKTAPVQMVSWYHAVEFCKKLSKMLNKDFRLPTEAEWEYACRAGTKTAYYWGDAMNGDYAWYEGNAKNSTQPVGGKKPNAFGLYDMSGNVWEWCSDTYSPYPKDPVADPVNKEQGGIYGPVIRGGCFGMNFDERYLRSAERNMCTGPAKDIGFRICCSVD